MKVRHLPDLALFHKDSGLIHRRDVESVGVFTHDVQRISGVTRVAENTDHWIDNFQMQTFEC